MSDTAGSEDKTEQPTARRLEKAREQGTIARAPGLSGAAVSLAGAAILGFGGGRMIELLERSVRAGLRLDPETMLEPERLLRGAWAVLQPGLELVLPLLVLLAVVAILADGAIGGWIFSFARLTPDFSRIDPLRGAGRLVSRDGLVEIVKSLGKFVVVGAVAFWLLRGWAPEFLDLAREPWPEASRHLAGLTTRVFLILALALAGAAALEVPYQLWSHRGRLRMTREELRDEQKELEGNPHTKRRFKTLRRKLARQRMMSEVPRADAVVANPEHYAAALSYREGRMRAPRLVAKGSGLVALRIRALAAEHGVPVIEAPPLARAICRFVELEEEIPVGLYQAVAEVLAYVYRLRAARDAGREAPVLPGDDRFNPPEEFRA